MVVIVSTWHKNYSTFVSPAFSTPYIQSVKTIVSYNVMITNINFTTCLPATKSLRFRTSFIATNELSFNKETYI